MIRRFAAAPVLALVMLCAGCGRADIPKPGSARYTAFLGAFYAGVTALETGATVDANDIALHNLRLATRLAPDEPAAWADLAVVEMKMDGATGPALADLKRAARLAPGDGRIDALYGALYGVDLLNRPALARKWLYAAASSPQSNAHIRWQYVRELQVESPQQNAVEISLYLTVIARTRPDNLFISAEMLVAATEAHSAALFGQAMKTLGALLPAPQADVRAELAELRKLGPAAAPFQLAAQAVVLRNLLRPLPAYRADEAAIAGPPDLHNMQPIMQPVAVPVPQAVTAPPNPNMTVTIRPLPGATRAPFLGMFSLQPQVSTVTARQFRGAGVYAAPEAPPALVTADGSRVTILEADQPRFTLKFPGGATHTPPTRYGIAAADLFYTFRPALVCAGAGGLRIYPQAKPGLFGAAAAIRGVSASIVNQPLAGVWPLGATGSGDMDLLLAPVDGAPVLLRNLGGGAFRASQPFSGAKNVRQLAVVDLDGEGAGAVALLDAAGNLRFYRNMHDGTFLLWPVPAQRGDVVAIAARPGGFGVPQAVVALTKEGAIRFYSMVQGYGMVDQPIVLTAPDKGAVLSVVDIDNNGVADIIVSGRHETTVALDGCGSHVTFLHSAVALGSAAPAPPSGDGVVRLVGYGADGTAAVAAFTASPQNHWVCIRTRSARVTRQNGAGSRVNSFGKDGEIEVRAGPLDIRTMITGPATQVGLGANTNINAIRINWPNGQRRAAYNVPEDQAVMASQELAWACP
ncbi:MAG: CRTAC1 family protein [Armatimonadetes bacterium]|nr:CRTAC1 family protein [Armatimonadota bacterium]MDE2207956.1 CRTAC1 family protein [Armatimonadota bacterium]